MGSSAVEDIDQLDVILERITRIVESEWRGLKEYGLYDYVCCGHVQILAQIMKTNKEYEEITFLMVSLPTPTWKFEH